MACSTVAAFELQTVHALPADYVSLASPLFNAIISDDNIASLHTVFSPIHIHLGSLLCPKTFHCVGRVVVSLPIIQVSSHRIQESSLRFLRVGSALCGTCPGIFATRQFFYRALGKCIYRDNPDTPACRGSLYRRPWDCRSLCKDIAFYTPNTVVCSSSPVL